MQPEPGCRMHGVALHVCPLSKLTAHTQLEAETSGSLMADGASRFSSFFYRSELCKISPSAGAGYLHNTRDNGAAVIVLPAAALPPHNCLVWCECDE